MKTPPTDVNLSASTHRSSCHVMLILM